MHRRLDTYLKGLLDPERMTFYETVCRFAEAEIAPHLVSWEREHQLLPTSAIAAMAEIGLFGVTVEERFGGAGGTLLDLVLVGLALGYHSQSVAITPGAAASLGEKPLQMFGSEGQKTAHLPESGERQADVRLRPQRAGPRLGRCQPAGDGHPRTRRLATQR